MTAIAMGCLLPQIVFEVFYARPSDVTMFADRVDYEFTSKDDALNFAMLDRDACFAKAKWSHTKLTCVSGRQAVRSLGE